MRDRTILAITGTDRLGFLQGLVTNDVEKAKDGIIYAALLTPQGKFIADFFIIGEADRLLIDVAADVADDLLRRLTMYRLRSDVQIDKTDLHVVQTADKGLPDPRHPELGFRHYSTDANAVAPLAQWDALRVAHLVPETGIELTPDSYILEAGFERLHGVDFKKGCYVGQEIVARMKHKTQLKKGLARVDITGAAKAGDAIKAGEKPVGTLHTVAGQQGIAYLRFDRATGPMQAGDAVLTLAD
ncbi:hypothetical protein DFP92_10332 [Yoonia sediminilitoris]|uniref:CAF17 C-terminal domain-containing protein n=1 Tax=Yoonia sediminilitoris TaxID=1286148 RepID=A0A2T6KJT5_9RHOB|nr:folate-binding protein YgfZ [Yoonia sediminilitoris]PUB16179.1 hypothetical protein C8N45_10332 [Yoonia sediminilitoris]RCW96528.1 hypothetical protein DFP92_10332 [Yoonia sediminilitoris]